MHYSLTSVSRPMLEILGRFINNERQSVISAYTPDYAIHVLDRFGNPHRRLTTIHVAGTNGKGSVAHMIQAVFSCAGYTTGLYTSPHLLEVNERITVGSRHIPEAVLERYAEDIIGNDWPQHAPRATYFDILTVIAFRYFADSHVDVAVIETGLGGRLDSTNVIAPLCSVITDISMDHAHVLGPTVEAIAAEKAGIIKKDTPVITSNTVPGIAAILQERADRLHAPLYRIGRDFRTDHVTGHDSGFRYDYVPITVPHPPISGIEIRQPLDRQVANSALAITAALTMTDAFPAITEAAIRTGLGNLKIPGRFELLSERPAVIFDPAHNVAALAAMMKLVKDTYPERDITLVMTLMKDKDIGGILSVLAGHTGLSLVYYILDDDRCFRPSGTPHAPLFISIIDNDESALKRQLDGKASGRSLFFFTGSFRLYRTALGYASGAGSPRPADE